MKLFFLAKVCLRNHHKIAYFTDEENVINIRSTQKYLSSTFCNCLQ